MDWLTNFHDWNISRQLVWGIRIPAWKCNKCKEVIYEPKYLQPILKYNKLKKEDKLMFIVEEGHIKRALGRDNSNLKRMEEILKKKIILIAFSKNVVKFINNLLYPLKVDNIQKEGNIIEIYVQDNRIKGKIYGRSRENIKWIIDLVKKYYDDIEDIKIK